MTNAKYLLPIFYVLASAGLAQARQQGTAPSPQKTNSHAAAQGSKQPEEGARIFYENCSRCHNSPDAFSPSVGGTVSMHMRVRASLSKHDQEELLRFLNP